MSLMNDLQVIQHDMARPAILMTINAMPALPRCAVLLVSEAHTGAVAVLMPFPIPAMTLRALSILSSQRWSGIWLPSCRHNSKVGRQELQERANHHDRCPNHDRSLSANPIPNWACYQSPNQAA